MNIPQSEWAEASGGYAVDARGELWRIVGFIDRPTVILDPVKEVPPADVVTMKDRRERQYLVMSSPLSAEYRRLIPEEGSK